MIEFQTEWKEEKLLDLMDYCIRFQRKEKLPIRPVMFLLNENKQARNIYADKNFHFVFDLIKLYDYNANEFMSCPPDLLPFVVLMKNGIENANQIQNKIYESNQEFEKKVDLLAVFNIFSGLRDKSIAAELLRKRRDIMIQSPVYDMILEEGIEKGIEKGKQDNARSIALNLLKMGLPAEQISQATGLSKKEIENLNK